jgi:phage RecT family recombinase
MTTTAITPYERMRSVLTSEAQRQAIAAYLHGTALSPKKFEQVALALMRDPKIVQCEPRSVMMAIAGAAQLGLQFIGGQAHIVPFKGQAQLIVGYQGYVNLLRKSGYVTFADVVYAGD